MAAPLKINIEVNSPGDARDRQELGNILKAEARVWSETLTTIRKANDDAKEKPE
jgi:hypothetical protein